MSTQYYLRVRGRILGPYDQEKLQSLAQRGQLSRMHEVSADGATWSRASSFPELFTAKLPTEPTWNGGGADAPATVTVEEPAARHGSTPGERPPQPGSQTWHYIAAGVECGPVDFSDLQMLAGTGQIGADDLVWTQNMQSWVPAKQVPGLVRPITQPARNVEAGTPSAPGDLPESLCRSAADARGWTMFIAIMVFIFAALQIVGGISLLALASRVRSGIGIAQGIFWLVNALLFCVAGGLLSTYASRLGGLRYSRHPVILERSLDSLRAFWIFLSIYLIVILAIVGMGVVYALSGEAMLPESLEFTARITAA